MSPSFSHSKSETAEERAEILFFEALQRSPAEHREFLDRECGSDVKLRSDVEDLLRVHQETGSFLKIDAAASPAFESAFAGYKPEIAGDCIGPYKLLEQIGEGGFGRVWVAEQARPIRRRVALKIIKLGMDTKEVIARFEQERQALAMMDHPHIAKVLDAGATPSGRPFFVMELVRGTKITEYCDEAQLSTGERLKLFIQVCSAVQHAHQKGIIHRDLKPSNILVTLHDGVPVPKVIDFGVAKATQQQRLTELTIYTQFEQMIGTPLYMAPEQAEMSGFDIDTRSDIYSLGVLLYELLTGRTPFDPERLMKAGFDEMRRVIREEEPQKPSTFVSTMTHEHRSTVARLRRSAEGAKLISAIKGDLDWIVMKALEKDRNRRYETANALARDIERHLTSQPVQARPASAGYRFRRFVGRNKGVATAGAAVAAALILGSAVSLWQAVRAQTALDELRSSAPAFAEQARSLVAGERFDEAIKKLDYAIKLRPDVADYALAKADLLQSQFRFAEAASVYRGALRLNPSEKRAEANAALCDKLAREAATQLKLSRQSLVELLDRMNLEQRLPAEMLMVGRLLGEESKLLRSFWMERLKDLPISPDKPLKDRLVSTKAGLLALDLSGTGVADLSPLEGMPLERLILAGCENVKDLRPLRGMPLRHLVLGRNGGDHSAAALRPCGIREISALAGLPLVSLDLEGIKLDDLTPLRGMPLEWLNLRETAIADLTPLKGMPLKHLDCTLIRARDFTPLVGAPLEVLNLQSTGVGELSFMRGMPLKSVLLNGCVEARGYQVLSEIPTLESAMLPAGIAELPMTEMKAVGELRNHPALRRIQIGGSRQEGMAAINTEANNANFWVQFDADLRARKALAQLVGEEPRFKRLKVTWEVYLEGLPISDISLLKDIPISTLDLTGTKVTDLTPLTGMRALRVLNLSGTGVRNLESLKGLELVGLFLENCTPNLDISPISQIPALQHLLLPPEPRNLEALQKHPNLRRIAYSYDAYSQQILLTAEEFWSQKGRSPAESAARSGSFALAEKVLRSQQSRGPMDCLSLGAVILAQGDEAGYRAHCRKVVAKVHAQNLPPDVAVKLCLLRPASGVALKDLETLLENDRMTGPVWKRLSSALLAYRDSRYREALRILEAIHPRVLGDFGPAPAASAIAAMCHLRLQNPDAARADLDTARRSVALFWPDDSQANASWWDGLIAYLLLKEAEGLISASVGSVMTE